jgi:hypothetical protein
LRFFLACWEGLVAELMTGWTGLIRLIGLYNYTPWNRSCTSSYRSITSTRSHHPTNGPTTNNNPPLPRPPRRNSLKLEVGWVEALRRRWKVLGILDEVLVKTEREERGGAEAGVEEVEGADGFRLDPLKEEDVDTDKDEVEQDEGKGAFGETGESARKRLIDGQLILTVLRNSFTRPGLQDDLDYRLRLVRLFRTYPTGLRIKLLRCIYENMNQGALARNVTARRVVLESRLFDRAYDPESGEDQGQVLSDPLKGESERVVLVPGEERVRVVGEIVKKIKAEQDVERVVRQEKGEEAWVSWRQQWEEVAGEWILRWAGRMTDDEEDLVSRASSVQMMGE